jgi:hypothetical protein
MTEVPQNAPLSARLGARLGPEAVASILAVPVVLLAVLVFLARGSGQPSAVVPPPGPTSSAQSSTAPSGAPATPTLAPTPTPDTTAARAVLQLVDELLANRTDLAAAVAPRRPNGQDIADRLRAVNATLVALVQPLDELGRDDRTADLAGRILAVSDATRDAVTETQRASITNVAAYRAGGRKVVDVMEPLVAIRTELVAVVGSAAPSAASPSAAP